MGAGEGRGRPRASGGRGAECTVVKMLLFGGGGEDCTTYPTRQLLTMHMTATDKMPATASEEYICEQNRCMVRAVVHGMDRSAVDSPYSFVWVICTLLPKPTYAQ